MSNKSPTLQTEAVVAMSRAFRHLEDRIARPVQLPFRNSFIYRYENKGIHEAILQKLARYISGLNAVAVLITTGYVQEANVIFRTLDEIQEDIFFLTSAETNDVRTERHTQYLEAFYSDPVFSRVEGSLDIPKPNLVTRKKIRAHTMNAIGKGVNISKALSVSESLGTAYSGYVHAASENIMEMYGGDPPRFHINGMRGTPRVTECAASAEHYIYRGLMATTVVAKAFGDAALVITLHEFMAHYESANGHETPPMPGKSV